MTSCPSSTTSATIWPRRRCGSSLSRSSRGTSRAAKQSGRKRRRTSFSNATLFKWTRLRCDRDGSYETIRNCARFSFFPPKVYMSFGTALHPELWIFGERRTLWWWKKSVSLILWMHSSTHLQPVMQFLSRRETIYIYNYKNAHTWLFKTDFRRILVSLFYQLAAFGTRYCYLQTVEKTSVEFQQT